MSRLDVKGKGAIVTGAGSGINLAFAKELYNAGCNVLIMDINLHKDAVKWLDSLPKDGPTKVSFHKASVADWKQLDAVFDVYAREFGGTPYLVCPGAGIYEPSVNGFWADQDVDDHYQLFDINLLAPIKMTRIAVRRMLQSNTKGIILHISSIAAQAANIITPLYAVSKHGVSAFIHSMASLDELAGIRVVGVAPGVVRSPLFLDHPEALRFLDFDKDPTIPPEEVARGMLAVATDPKYPPGTVLEVADFGNWRVVPLLNNPGPQGKAKQVSNKDLGLEDVKKMLEKDRSSAK